jgi:uncharacterized BrkB/YihY/UPF0761 family membrane protein
MENKNAVGAILAITFTIIFAGVLLFLLYWTVPTANEKYILLLIGALVGYVSAGIQFFLGSSLSSSKKDDTIAAMAPPKGDSTTPTTVVSAPPGP